MAITDLIKCQSGQEVAWGTSLAATAKWMGVTNASISIVSDIVQSDKSGFLYPAPYAVLGQFSGEGVVDMDLSYEDMIYPLDNFFSQCTPVGTVWTYTAPTTAIVTPNFYTLEIGAPDAEYEASGALFTELNISGEAGGVWKGSFPFISDDVDDGAMAALVDRAVEFIRMADTALHLDNWGTAAGTAAASASTLISFALHVANGRHLKLFGGDVSPTAWGDTMWTGTLQMVCEFNATAKAIVDALLAPALIQRAIRIAATSGGKYAYIDFYGTLDSGTQLFSDRDGNITVGLNWIGTWQPTQEDWLEIIIDNDFVGALV